MNTRKFFCLTAAVSAAMLFSACKEDYAGKEQNHPLFKKAMTAAKSADYQEASKHFEDFLVLCPKSSRTHYELANIYGDNMNDYVKAVYHFGKWLEMNPNSQDSGEIITLRDNAKKNLFKQMQEEYKDDAALNAAAEELTKTKAELEKYVKYIEEQKNYVAALEKQNAQMKDMLKNARTTRQRTRTAVTKQENKQQNQAAVKQTKNTKQTTAQKQGSVIANHTVQKGETLVKISQKYYGSRMYYKLIANANKGKIKGMQVRVGQVIVIPALPKR
ncbi:MAG: LysM peptidoglycan-binding domain-containing protein [Lentisphaeria bacterium]|nr:LysM peptidoglycan-binding domain-containing protein [Lentisphaeria bacterium]